MDWRADYNLQLNHYSGVSPGLSPVLWPKKARQSQGEELPIVKAQ